MRGKNVKGRKVEQPYTESSEATKAEVEGENWCIFRSKPSVEPSQGNSSSCGHNSDQCDKTVAKTWEQGGSDWSEDESEECEKRDKEGGVGSTNVEAGGNGGEEHRGGVDCSPAEERKGKGGGENPNRMNFASHCFQEISEKSKNKENIGCQKLSYKQISCKQKNIVFVSVICLDHK